MPPKQSANTYFPALTGLRFVAASMIYFSHFYRSIAPNQEFLQNIFKELHTGVSFFFILSGFLIGLRYFHSFSFSKKWLQKFIVNRIIRIYPVFILVSIFISLTHNFGFMNWFYTLTLIKGFFDEYKFVGIAPSWTITVEFTFYLLVPIIFKFLGKYTLIPISIILLTIGCLLCFFGSYLNFHGFFGNFNFTFIYTFFGRSFEFLLGTYIGALYINKIQVNKTIKYTLTGLPLILIFQSILIYLQKFTNHGLGLFHPFGLITNNFLLPIGIILFVIGLSKEKSVFSSALSHPLFQLLGKSSFAFFLIHYTSMSDLIKSFSSNNMLLHYIIFWVISTLIYKFYELPVATFLTSKLVRK